MPSHLDGFGRFGQEAAQELGPRGPAGAVRASEALDGAGCVLGPTEAHRVAGGDGAPHPGLSSLVRAELRSLPIKHLPALTPTTLLLSASGCKFAFTSSRAWYRRLLGDKLPCFVGGEYTLMALAAQNDRFWPDDLAAAIERKKRQPRWRLGRDVAIGPVFNLEPLTWSVGETLDRVGAKLVGLKVG